jgi:phosphatidylinositol alpha-1,6-mannosyltransferase
MPLLWQSHPDAHCLLVGDGPERAALVAAAGQLERPGQVRLLAEADDRTVAAAYAACSVFALPAVQLGPDVEGFGIVCLEAAQAGLPVVTTTAGGVGESVRAGETGFTVEPGDPRALAEALRLLLASPERAKSMGEAGRAWAATFSWERSAAELESAVTRALL